MVMAPIQQEEELVVVCRRVRHGCKVCLVETVAQELQFWVVQALDQGK